MHKSMHLQHNYWVVGYCLQNQDDQMHEQYQPGEARNVECLQEAGSDIIFALRTKIDKGGSMLIHKISARVKTHNMVIHMTLALNHTSECHESLTAGQKQENLQLSMGPLFKYFLVSKYYRELVTCLSCSINPYCRLPLGNFLLFYVHLLGESAYSGVISS